MKQCSICGLEAAIIQGHQWLCEKHYRFRQMRSHAKRHGKKVPTRDELEAMRGADLICPDCDIQMNWRAKDGQETVASLQHYRDGSLAIVCRSCNTRHAYMDGDSYKDMPKTHKMCPSCKQTKDRAEFYMDNGRSGLLKSKSSCKECSDKAVAEWRITNREQYNAKQREYRAKRKADGNPITRKPHNPRLFCGKSNARDHE